MLAFLGGERYQVIGDHDFVRISVTGGHLVS
jgi:hypothetical protein